MARDIRPWLRLLFTAMDDPIIQRIERFRCSRGTLCAEHRNRGYTHYSAHSGALVARLRPTGCDDSFEYSIGRSGRSDGPRLARLDAPSCRSMTR